MRMDHGLVQCGIAEEVSVLRSVGSRLPIKLQERLDCHKKG
jgi:hypothetical protein